VIMNLDRVKSLFTEGSTARRGRSRSSSTSWWRSRDF